MATLKSTLTTAAMVAAICVATSSTSFATDHEDYRFRYDFSSGVNNFIGTDAQRSDPLVKGGTPEYNRVYGPNGDSTAVHPTSAD